MKCIDCGENQFIHDPARHSGRAGPDRTAQVRCHPCEGLVFTTQRQWRPHHIPFPATASFCFTFSFSSPPSFLSHLQAIYFACAMCVLSSCFAHLSHESESTVIHTAHVPLANDDRDLAHSHLSHFLEGAVVHSAHVRHANKDWNLVSMRNPQDVEQPLSTSKK